MTMPGAFAFEDADFSAPVAKPSFYIPPSPSASSVLSSSIARTLSCPASHVRKRPRVDVSEKSTATPRGIQRNDTFTSTYSFDAPSPAPLVNTDYRIAGGLDTPTAEKLLHEERIRFDYEQDLRPNRYGVPPSTQTESYFPLTPSSVGNDRRKRRHSSSPRRHRPGWGHTVWAMTGGVAGRVIDFCWNTAFQGFHAGGGQAYRMQIDTPTVTASNDVELKGSADVFDAEYRGRDSTPGGFPEDDLIEDYMSRPQSHQQEDTPTQYHHGQDRSALKGNWVMVNEPYADSETSPARKKVRPSTASMASRPTSRGSLPVSVRPRLQPRSGASYASPRGSGIGMHLHAQTRPQSSQGFHKGHKRSRSSIAQPRQADSHDEHNTPKSPEVLKFEKKLRKKDHKQDQSIHRLNQQMQDMIKEAQQALGSKVEVTDDVDDEGYGEGTDISVVSRW